MFRLAMGLAVALIGIGAATLRGYWHNTAEPAKSPGIVADLLLGGGEDGAPDAADPPQMPVSLELQLSQIQHILEQELMAATAAERAAAADQQDGAGPAVIAISPAGCGLDGSVAGDGCGTAELGNDALAAPAGQMPSTGPESAAQVRVFRPRQ